MRKPTNVHTRFKSSVSHLFSRSCTIEDNRSTTAGTPAPEISEDDPYGEGTVPYAEIVDEWVVVEVDGEPLENLPCAVGSFNVGQVGVGGEAYAIRKKAVMLKDAYPSITTDMRVRMDNDTFFSIDDVEVDHEQMFTQLMVSSVMKPTEQQPDEEE